MLGGSLALSTLFAGSDLQRSVQYLSGLFSAQSFCSACLLGQLATSSKRLPAWLEWSTPPWKGTQVQVE